MTKAQKIEVTGRAIAWRLRDRDFSGARLVRAIEEAADDMHGADTVAGQFLAATDLENIRDWKLIVRQAKKTHAILRMSRS